MVEIYNILVQNVNTGGHSVYVYVFEMIINLSETLQYYFSNLTRQLNRTVSRRI